LIARVLQCALKQSLAFAATVQKLGGKIMSCCAMKQGIQYHHWSNDSTYDHECFLSEKKERGWV